MAKLTITGFEMRSLLPEAKVNVLCDGKSVGRFGPSSPMPIDLPEGCTTVRFRQFLRPSALHVLGGDNVYLEAKLNPLPSEASKPAPYVTGAVVAFALAVLILAVPGGGVALKFAALVTLLPLALWVVQRLHPQLPVAFRRADG